MIDCNLTAKEKVNANGCGSSYWLARPFRIPRWVSGRLHQCCNCHDAQYQRQTDKQIADNSLTYYIYDRAAECRLRLVWNFWSALAQVVEWALSTELSRMAYEKAGELSKTNF